MSNEAEWDGDAVMSCFNALEETHCELIDKDLGNESHAALLVLASFGILDRAKTSDKPIDGLRDSLISWIKEHIVELTTKPEESKNA